MTYLTEPSKPSDGETQNGGCIGAGMAETYGGWAVKTPLTLFGQRCRRRRKNISFRRGRVAVLIFAQTWGWFRLGLIGFERFTPAEWVNSFANVSLHLCAAHEVWADARHLLHMAMVTQLTSRGFKTLNGDSSDRQPPMRRSSFIWAQVAVCQSSLLYAGLWSPALNRSDLQWGKTLWWGKRPVT